MKINQIKESEVLDTLCEEIIVYRFNIETGTAKDLTGMAIKTIAKDFGDSRYLYFTVSE